MTAPILHSNAASPNKVYLAFDGWTGPIYGNGGQPVTTPQFAVPSAIGEIVAYVASLYLPFNIDFTTERPASGKYATCAIGGAWSDWSGVQQSGVTFINGWNMNLLTNYVFAADSLGNNPDYVARCIAHECGHLFGLQHQSVWANGVMTEEYKPNCIMGNFLYGDIAWINGTSRYQQPQDDLAILTSVLGASTAMPQAKSIAITYDDNSVQSYQLGGFTVSPDGTLITAPTSATLTDINGAVWSFGGTGSQGAGYVILVNGVQVEQSEGTKIGIKNGHIYAQNSNGPQWYLRSGQWSAVANPF